MPIGAFKLNSISAVLSSGGGGGTVYRDNPMPSTYTVEGSVRTGSAKIGTYSLGPASTTSSELGFSVNLSNPGTQTYFNASTICCYEFWFKATLDTDRKLLFWSTNSSITNMSPTPADQTGHMILFQDANNFKLTYFRQFFPVTLGARDSNWHHLAVQSNGNGYITVWYDGVQVLNYNVGSWTQRNLFYHCMGYSQNSTPVAGNSVYFDEIVITHGAQKYTPGVDFTPYTTAQVNAAKTIGLFHCESTSQTDDVPAQFGDLSPGVGWTQFTDFVDPTDGYTYRAWYANNSGTFFDIASTANPAIYEYILVGGGGGGGGCATSTSYHASGGGGGGFTLRGKTVYTAGQTINYSIGAGGVGAITAAYKPGSESSLTVGGGAIVYAPGGGGGGFYSTTGATNGQTAATDTSGQYQAGGGGAKHGIATGANGTGGSGNYNGGAGFGSATTTARSSGGGGSGGGWNKITNSAISGGNNAAGSTSGVGGNGGAAITISNFIYSSGTGVPLYLGAGGGGSGTTVGTGGTGGGNGAANTTKGGNATNANDRAGGGGGGCRRTSAGTYAGGNGANGAMWIRYRIA